MFSKPRIVVNEDHSAPTWSKINAFVKTKEMSKQKQGAARGRVEAAPAAVPEARLQFKRTSNTPGASLHRKLPRAAAQASSTRSRARWWAEATP